MKSLKKTFALLALVTLGFGCASVTDAGLNDQPDAQVTDQTTPPPVIFGEPGNEMEPIVERPE